MTTSSNNRLERLFTMAKPIRFSAVRRVLEHHGFSVKRVPGSHYLFTHAATGAAMTFPMQSPNATVRSPFVIAAARVLDERGIVARDVFRHELMDASAGNGKTPDSKPSVTVVVPTKLTDLRDFAADPF